MLDDGKGNINVKVGKIAKQNKVSNISLIQYIFSCCHHTHQYIQVRSLT